MSENLGEFLKDIREKRRLTLRSVEEKTGVSNAYLSQLENSKILKPSPEILFKLAEVFNVDYSHLMELAGYPNVTVKQQKFRISSELSNLSNDEEEELIEYLNFLRSKRKK